MSEHERELDPLPTLERATAWVERPIRSTSRSNRLNPLPHAGTISVFLLLVVVLSGIYVTLFFEYGYEASYDAVVKLENHPIQRAARALHRYSSAALVLTTLVHGWRILVNRRFTGRRRHWRWATGIASLVLVWLAGVTGYWLIWDVRAQAITEAFVGFVSVTSWGTNLATGTLLDPTSSGSTVLVVIWFLHLLLTGVIGWFLFRHLRRSQLSWLPPRHWMALMTGALVLVSLALPAGTLGPADQSRLPVDMPLDPFVLFLLPPMLSSGRWLAAVALMAVIGAALALPKLLDRRRNDVVAIDADACTGCELCVVDCPYLALTMIDRDPVAPSPRAEPAGRRDPVEQLEQLAKVDPAACVGCGICLGSCAFGAMTLPGMADPAAIDPEGRPVVIACDRHLTPTGLRSVADELDDPVVLPVRCAGMFDTRAVGQLEQRGARSVQLIGCPPADCRYGTGNLLASERLGGDRRPHLPRRWQGLVAEDWVAPTDLRAALRDPGGHPAADASKPPGGRETLIGAGLVVMFSVLAVGFATRAPFRASPDRAAIRVVVDHRPGADLATADGPAATGGGPVSLTVSIDGGTVASEDLSTGGDRAVAIVDVDAPTGTSSVDVVLSDGTGAAVLLSGSVDLAPGDRLVVEGRDVPAAPGATEGEDIFNSRNAGCQVCHSVEPGDDGVGPSLAGVASVAGDRVEGLDAALYLRQSILLPDQYVVEGYPAGQMLPIYRERLSEQELESLIAYLLTLEDES